MVERKIGKVPAYTRQRKTKMLYGVEFKCACTIGRIEGLYEDGNPWDIHDDFICPEHGETYVVRVWGRSQ